MNNLCPVCGYQKMPYPANDYNICPCCGTEFEADDFETSHAELREIWRKNGMKWYSRRIPQPYDFNPAEQLLELLNFREASDTVNGIPQSQYQNVVLVDFASITADVRDYVWGVSAMNLGAGIQTI